MTVKKVRDLENSVTEKVCQNLIEVVELQKDAMNFLGTKPRKNILEETRQKAIEVFKENVRDRMETVYQEENIEEKFTRLDEYAVKMKGQKGWRPSGDPKLDTYGPRRAVLVAEIERLEKLRDSFADQLESKREGFMELKQKVDTCMAELGGL